MTRFAAQARTDAPSFTAVSQFTTAVQTLQLASSAITGNKQLDDDLTYLVVARDNLAGHSRVQEVTGILLAFSSVAEKNGLDPGELDKLSGCASNCAGTALPATLKISDSIERVLGAVEGDPCGERERKGLTTPETLTLTFLSETHGLMHRIRTIESFVVVRQAFREVADLTDMASHIMDASMVERVDALRRELEALGANHQLSALSHDSDFTSDVYPTVFTEANAKIASFGRAAVDKAVVDLASASKALAEIAYGGENGDPWHKDIGPGTTDKEVFENVQGGFYPLFDAAKLVERMAALAQVTVSFCFMVLAQPAVGRGVEGCKCWASYFWNFGNMNKLMS